MEVTFVHELEHWMRSQIEALLRSSLGFFTEAEIQIALEVFDEAHSKGGEQSGYYFICAVHQQRVLGYIAYGLVPCTKSSFDVYWIAVQQEHKNQKLGHRLMSAAEADIHKKNGTRIYIDTSSRFLYAPTHAFYERCGYELATHLEDFYAPGDGKNIYLKVLS